MREFKALYRKYRPQKFEEVVGQDHVTGVLARSVKEGSVSHSYLFAGPRGIGKTSIARIFSRAIGARENDITEIDAASNRRIDDARELRETISSLPMESPYKVYIIDEVHMLTPEAFNALLKTLEEPPSHVVFILATTEVDKLPDTIVSRCQVYTFRRPNHTVVQDLLASVAKKEGLTLEPTAVRLIALLADGSFRDALGVLQKVASSSGKDTITARDVEVITGTPSTQRVEGFIQALAEGDSQKGLSALRSVEEENMDPELFFERVLQKIRFILLVRFSGEARKIIEDELSEDEFTFVTSMAENTSFSFSSNELKEFLEALELSRTSSVKIFPLEMAFLDVLERLKNRAGS